MIFFIDVMPDNGEILVLLRAGQNLNLTEMVDLCLDFNYMIEFPLIKKPLLSHRKVAGQEKR